MSLFKIIIEKCTKNITYRSREFFYSIMACGSFFASVLYKSGKEVLLYLLNPHEWVNIAMILVSFIVLFYVIGKFLSEH
ncbi:MAG: hypothetical protein IPF46_00010 [Saprospiraceae bacterium]|nr:hypothetical protein [Candidatus Vicinibacter affinis]